MESRLFHYVAFSVIISILLAFIFVTAADITGLSVAQADQGSSAALFILFVIFGAAAIMSIRFNRPETESPQAVQTGPALDYIDQAMAYGVNPSEIERGLVEQGWPVDYVRKVISDKYYLALQNSNPVKLRTRKKRRHYWF